MTQLKFVDTYSASHVYALLQKQGCRPAMSPAVLSAAMEVMNDTPNGDVLETVKVFFRSKAVVTPDGL